MGSIPRRLEVLDVDPVLSFGHHVELGSGGQWCVPADQGTFRTVAGIGSAPCPHVASARMSPVSQPSVTEDHAHAGEE